MQIARKQSRNTSTFSHLCENVLDTEFNSIYLRLSFGSRDPEFGGQASLLVAQSPELAVQFP